MAQKNSTLRRPNRSLMNPAIMAPGMHPTMAAAVASPIRNESLTGSRWKNCFRKVLAPLITAVS